MIIFAKNGKEKEKLEKPLVVNEVLGSECGVDHTVLDPNSGDVEAWLSPSTRRRVSTATTICVFITALLVMSIGIIGGVYLYRAFSHHQTSRFRGWCGIPFERESLSSMGNPKLPLEGNPSIYRNDDIEGPSESLFNEEFELDLDEDMYEEIHVPDFGFGRQGRFIHDFKTNMTGIIDLSSGHCYVMPLDRTHVLPPRTIMDLVKKMWLGYYNVDTQVLRQTMRVTRPPVVDFTSLGTFIAHDCATYPTFRLKRIYTSDLKKRSVDNLEESNKIDFVEFAGNKIIKLTIIDDRSDSEQ
ncbi:integral membrane protein 2C-like [Homarus americanus]|uniref:integral membrane protein 2C-like n=1 Tax=Homarus americanus TaxID=6706 RepID=UPI001C457856|nr:integral membrane protein 2C-like [Homarus americanus]